MKTICHASIIVNLLFASVLPGPRGSVAQSTDCTIADFMEAENVVATCCESFPGNCAESFPATCAHTCARLVVPYFDQCDSMIKTMAPTSPFTTFPLDGLVSFADSCRQTLILYEHASNAGSCTEDGVEISLGLVSRVDAVTSACCEQNGRYVCTAGEPSSCDAECAAGSPVPASP
jgi:hypothetical protein